MHLPMHLSIALYRLLAKQFEDENKEAEKKNKERKGSYSMGSIDSYMKSVQSSAKSMMPHMKN